MSNFYNRSIYSFLKSIMTKWSGVRGSAAVNFVMPPRSYTVIFSNLRARSKLIQNRINSFEISCVNKTPFKRRRRLRYVN